MNKIKFATIISCIALVAFVLSSCNEDSVTPIESENDLNLPTVQAPAGGWTTEELALISEFGSITEVTPSNDWVSGIKRTITYTAERGDVNANCSGNTGYCSNDNGVLTSETIDGDDCDTIVIKWVNEIEGFRLKSSSSGGKLKGATDNGLLPISDYLVMDQESCNSFGISSFVIYPGLYLIKDDSLQVIYVNGYIE